MKKEKPKFYAMRRNFNSSKMETIEVLEGLFNEILTKNGKLNKHFTIWEDNKVIPVKTISDLKKYIKFHFMYHYWGKCEHEFIVINWPYRTEVKVERDGENADLISINSPEKIDVFGQLKPNLDVITNLVWEYIKDKIK